MLPPAGSAVHGPGAGRGGREGGAQVPEQHRHRVHPLVGRQPERLEHAHGGLDPADLAGPHHPLADRDPRQPRVPRPDVRHQAGELLGLLAPRPDQRLRTRRLLDGGVDHDRLELVLVGDVAVERHLGQPHLGGHPLHREPGQSVAVRHLDGGPRDLVEREPAAGAPRRLVRGPPEERAPRPLRRRRVVRPGRAAHPIRPLPRRLLLCLAYTVSAGHSFSRRRSS